MTLTLDAQTTASLPVDFTIAADENLLLQPSIATQIEEACARIAPLWPLKNFVAVNPFVGLSDKNFLDACMLVRRVAHGDMTMPLSYYRRQWEAGRISEADLQSALKTARQTLPAAQAVAVESLTVQSLKNALQDSSNTSSVTSANIASADAMIFTVADLLDHKLGTQWHTFIVDEISKWCSAYYDAGQASWRMPWRDEPLFAAWKQAALRDANPEMMGVRDFRQLVKALPDDALDAIEYSLQILQVPTAGTVGFLHRQLMSIAGWSGYVQYQVREKGMYGKQDDSLQGLLAIRLAYEIALYRQDAKGAELWTQNVAALQDMADDADNDAAAPDIMMAYLWQLAAENSYQRGLMKNIQTVAPTPSTAQEFSTAPRLSEVRPAVQAVFCIDVRSEVMRRCLEATSPDIETIGFAGFFGFPIEYVPFGQRHGSVQCPVLLTPKFRIRESLPDASHSEIETALHKQLFSKRLSHSWNSFKTSAVSCFSFVETGGLLSGLKLVKDSLGLHHDKASHNTMAPCIQRDAMPQALEGAEHSHLHESGMSLEEQVTVAAGALKNMGLTTNFARLVMICGHGSSTTNNPYSSGLDCGACGGHSGEANARVAAAVLNHPSVRAGLKAQNIVIPEDTLFIAALHNTTTDDVKVLDEHLIPVTHEPDMKTIKRCLAEASHQTRVQRAPLIGLADVAETKIDQQVRARSLDWAQTRPEWGLSGNAAFIAAPRSSTKGLNLSGRTFLHNYDYNSDADGSILELVMTAPMIVASWINLQYFASTVNNRQFGSGNKTIHNVVGTVGVWQGNSGDLQVGLPLQSVHDGKKWMHEPLRLSVFIEAPRHAINAVLEKHDGVRDLLDNGWLHLIAIEDGGKSFARYSGDLHWKSVENIAD